MWKRQYISKGGRITLIRSSSLPIYYMSILHLPRVVKLKLEQIQRNFLWGEGALEQRLHLVTWTTICLDKRKGGLRVKRLRAFLRSTRLSYANRASALRMREGPYGIK